MRDLGRRPWKTCPGPGKNRGGPVCRPYNGFVEEAHKGIPHKFASRGVQVIPLDFLDLENEPSKRHMYWGMGQRIMAGARKVKAHDQLFGTYITNFSCGPDSFLIGYFRDVMGRKPSLTLELDSHTADAGLETRIEAFLDIVQAYRKLGDQIATDPVQAGYRPARTEVENGTFSVVDSSGRVVPYTDPRVTLLFPAMGDLAVKVIRAIFKATVSMSTPMSPAMKPFSSWARDHLVQRVPAPDSDHRHLLNYIRNKRPDEIVLYFMPTGSGPCRFGQYRIFMEDLVQKLQIPDVAMFSLSSDDGYDGLPTTLHRRGWWGVLISDMLEDIRAMLLANARDVQAGMEVFEICLQEMLSALDHRQCRKVGGRAVPGRRSAGAGGPQAARRTEVPVISLTGEIFVRRDGLSRQYLTEQLAAKGFATVCAPVAEWILYSDYMVNKGFGDHEHTGLREKNQRPHQAGFSCAWTIGASGRSWPRSGLVHAEPIHVHEVIETAAPLHLTLIWAAKPS
jgi:hypothetical protein